MDRIALALVLGCVGSCVLELDDDPACGDGYFEPTTEECDPAVPESYVGACGDGRVGVCLAPQCEIDWAACEAPCGNGVLDPQEECDPGMDGTEWAQPGDAFEGNGPACADLAPFDGGDPYVRGQASRCLSDCRWDRSPCDRCGDGELQPGEVCEATRSDLDAADAFCRSACVGPDLEDRPERVFCNTVCADDCLGYTVAADEDLGCCIPSGHPVNAAIRCCQFEQDGVCVPGLGE